MKDNLSPEEKLLRLIKGQKKKDFSANQSVVSGSSTVATAAAAPKHPFDATKVLSFFSFNKLIWLFFAAACAYLAISFLHPLISSDKIELPVITKEAISEKNMSEGKEAVRPLEYYSKVISGRQIFNVPAAKEEIAEVASSANMDFIKNISLVGIIAGDNPQAIVEDKNTQKTHYVSKGQFVGACKIEEIQEGKIIVSCGGQKYELYL
ncbi:MAG: hypothetical protein WCI77_10155 [Candidatus Omnitrophota bacterium]